MMTFSYVLHTCCELGKYKVSIASVSHYNISVEVPIRVFSQMCRRVWCSVDSRLNLAIETSVTKASAARMWMRSLVMCYFI